MGATGRATNLMLIGESLIYGILGGSIGSCLGIGFLYLMTYIINQFASSNAGISFEVMMDFSLLQVLVSMLAAMLLCLAGSIIPILKISRISIKDIILNFIQKPKGRKKWRLLLGIALIAVSFALAFVESDDFRPVAAALGMILSLTSIIMLIPYLTDLFISVFEGIYLHIFGNIGVIAAKNLRNNKNIVSSISMLAIGISSLLMINTAGYDSAVFINDMYRNTKYDIEVYTWRADRNFARLMLNIDGVADVYGDYSFYRVELAGRKDYISEVKGIDRAKFPDFFSLDMDGDLQKAFDELDQERSLLVSETLQKTLKVEVGDYISLKTETGDKPYKIIGTFRRLIYRGRIVL
jgi:putative ABC transport system permease protein